MANEPRSRRGPTAGLISTAALCILAAAAVAASAQEFDGVQPAALDQPRVTVLVHHPSTYGRRSDQAAGQPIEAFLDTGASGTLLSEDTARAAGVGRESVDGTEARFHDVGVAGGDAFAISDPLTVTIENTTLVAGPARVQVGPLGGGQGLDALVRQLSGDLNVLGMPAMVGRVVVMDVRAVNGGTGKIHTTVLDGLRTARAGPRCRRHVRLSYAAFDRYTTTTPATALPPALAANPFIGPGPVGPPASRSLDFRSPTSRPSGSRSPARPGNVPPVVVEHAGKRSTGSWLVDTGAATSMISKAQAARLGVTYVAGTENTADPRLAGVPVDRQFTLTIGGIGGSRKAAGFYLDRLTLATTEGRPVTYRHAPVLVADVTVTAAAIDAGGTSVTLDGVFGMNFLVASMKVPDGALPDLQDIHPGPYQTVVFDQPKGLLGLD